MSIKKEERTQMALDSKRESAQNFRPQTGLQSLSSLQSVDGHSTSPEASLQGEALSIVHSQEFREAARTVCKQVGLEILEYTDATELLAARMVTESPRVILLEAQGEFAKTYAIYGQLRQTSVFSEVPVLFVVTPAQASETIDACNLQTNDYIVKPFTSNMLCTKIKALLRPSKEVVTPGKFPAGSLLGRRYEVVRFLGEGGMGQVYQVRDLREGGEYALKLLFNNGEEIEPQAVKRFQKEIEALLALNHPNIIQIFDYGQHHTFSYYTMDYLPYGCLADLIDEKGALSCKQAFQLLIPIASALHHAHQNNLLHRDLKPGNIMFRREGAPILTDFGLALQIENRQTRLTKKGHIIGTANYMSPEQITAPQTLDGRADIYALGAMFFEMITGRPPFVGANYVDVLRQVLSQPPPDPRQFRKDLPEHVSIFCQIAMTRDRDKRFPTAAAMIAAAAKLLTIS